MVTEIKQISCRSHGAATQFFVQNILLLLCRLIYSLKEVSFFFQLFDLILKQGFFFEELILLFDQLLRELSAAL